MPKIVSNTTPILSILKIGKLDLLREIYGEITIPNAVHQEIETGRNKVYYQDLRLLNWIKIEDIKNTDSRAYFVDLDDGEAEVLILAKESNADLVIMDEVMGRRYARQLEFSITGTIGILLKAKANGIISSVSKLLTELSEKGTWLSPKLISKAKELANE